MDKVAIMNIMDKSDKTILRCIENGIPIPIEWKAYRIELRNLIVACGDTLPNQPPYPAGT